MKDTEKFETLEESISDSQYYLNQIDKEIEKLKRKESVANFFINLVGKKYKKELKIYIIYINILIQEKLQTKSRIQKKIEFLKSSITDTNIQKQKELYK